MSGIFMMSMDNSKSYDKLWLEIEELKQRNKELEELVRAQIEWQEDVYAALTSLRTHLSKTPAPAPTQVSVTPEPISPRLPSPSMTQPVSVFASRVKDLYRHLIQTDESAPLERLLTNITASDFEGLDDETTALILIFVCCEWLVASSPFISNALAYLWEAMISHPQSFSNPEVMGVMKDAYAFLCTLSPEKNSLLKEEELIQLLNFINRHLIH